jgi:MinD-like ATPase involved in chromosome partitioning or flagellar assembly
LALALAGMLAHVAVQPVLAVEGVQRPFSGLRPRTLFRSHATAWDVLQTPHVLAAESSARLVTQTDPSGLHILVAEEDLTPPRRPLTLWELGQALSYAYRTYGVVVVDLPPFAPRMAGAVENAAGLLVVCRAGVESLAHAQHLLGVLSSAVRGPLAGGRCVVVVNATSSRVPRAVTARVSLLVGSGAVVVRVPYDPGLAGGPVDVRRLRRKTRAALAEVAVALLRPVTSMVGGGGAGAS